MNNRPDCFRCKHMRKLENSPRVMCVMQIAVVTGHPEGIAEGLFEWPDNYNPTMLESCDKFERSDI